MGLLDKFKPGSEGPGVAFVGIDGVPRSLVRDLVDEGRLPNLEALAETGGLSGMDAVVPAESSACWPAMTTGTNPGKTGVLGFQDREEGSYETYIPLGRHVRSERVWNVAGREGRRSVVSNVPVTYPPEDINGVMVSGFLTPDVDQVSNDDSVVDYLESIDYRVDVDASLGHEDKMEFVRNARETLDANAEALYHFIEEEDWSLLWHVFMATDRVNHFLWENYEEGTPLADEFREFYSRVDEIIGETRRRLPDDCTLIVAADHGFTTLDREVDMNAWLRREGWQEIDGDSLEDITSDSRAYSLIPGRFYLNLEGREPRGSVPEEDYDSVREELREMLLDLGDPDGEPVVDRVVMREEVYSGPMYDRTPDLVALPNWGYDLKAGFKDDGVFTKGERNGMHTFEDAALMIEDHRVQKDDATILDVAPTVLDLMELEVPEDMDGESLVTP